MTEKKRIHFDNEKVRSQNFAPKIGNMLEEKSQGYLCLYYIVGNFISDVESLLRYGNLLEWIQNREASMTSTVMPICAKKIT